MKNNVFTSYITNGQFFNKVGNSNSYSRINKRETFKKNFQTKYSDEVEEFPIITENIEPEVTETEMEEHNPTTTEVIVNDKKEKKYSLICKLKDDICYLYGVVSNLNKNCS